MFTMIWGIAIRSISFLSCLLDLSLQCWVAEDAPQCLGGIDDLQRSLLTPINLWFCDLWWKLVSGLQLCKVLTCSTEFALQKLRISAYVPLGQPAGWGLIKSNFIIIFVILGKQWLIKTFRIIGGALKLIGYRKGSLTEQVIFFHQIKLNAHHCWKIAFKE